MIIAAISTSLEPAAIGIVRLSGEGCIELASRVFEPAGGIPLNGAPERKMLYGSVRDLSGAVIDRGLAFVSRAPASYTGEDCAELHCHGSPVVLSEVMTALLQLGARPAEAGEFTKRAFLNGRMDLTEAEAVVDIIEAETAEAAKNAAAQLEGAIYRKTGAIYSGLIDMIAHFQAVIDYPDEEIEPLTAMEMRQTLNSAAFELKRLTDSFERGRFLKNGLPAAIIGSPNCGKSTLLNALLGYERAIVTELAGTTRDTIEECVRLGGVLLRLADTAGIRGSDDRVEALGVERSIRAAAGAKLVLLVFDGSRPLEESDRSAIEAAKSAEHVIALINKCDLPRGLEPDELRQMFETVIEISATEQTNFDKLEAAVSALFGDKAAPGGEVLTNLRQKEAVSRAYEAVSAAAEALREGVTPDAVLSDAELALAALGELLGKNVSEDIINDIFSRFCVGK